MSFLTKIAQKMDNKRQNRKMVEKLYRADYENMLSIELRSPLRENPFLFLMKNCFDFDTNFLARHWVFVALN